MSGQSLDYTILNKNKIDVIQGKIDSICQKNSEGCIVKANQEDCKFTLELKLKNKAIIKMFELKTKSINKFIFELYGQKDTYHQTVEHCFSKSSQSTLIQVKESFSRRKQTTKIKLEVECLENTNGIIGLGYLLVRGEKCKEQAKNKSISKALGQNDQFYDPKISKHYRPGISKPDIFSQRKRNKDTVEKKQESEESQIKKVIQLSKKEAELSKKKQKQKRNEVHQQQFLTIDQRSNSYNPQQRDYVRIDYDKHKNIFKYVSAAWLQAQSAAQKEKGIPQKQRLSKAIVVRIFNNKNMCIDVSDRQKKRRLEKICEEMGAKLKKELEDYCLLITDRVDTERIARARKLKGVKILKSEFVTECSQCQAYLEEKDYFFK